MKKIIILIFVIILLAAGWYFVSPLFISNTVQEDIPDEFSNFVIPTEEEFNSMSPEEREKAEKEMIEMFADKGNVVEEPMEEELITKILKNGSFVDADSFHKGSGLAKILVQGESSLLRLEDFSVTNGPDLHVLLVEGSNPTDRDNLGEYIDLGQLKGNEGNQNYQIPEGVDLEKYGSVVIYCKPFHVVFSVATLNN